jgi:hypothetical protein
MRRSRIPKRKRDIKRESKTQTRKKKQRESR